MTLEQFIAKWQGKKADFDGKYDGQCVDLYRFYVKEVLDFPQSPPVVGAADIFSTTQDELYTKIKNTPEGVPQKGDIVIWNKRAGSGFGHVAIFIGGDVNRFTSFDQNWRALNVCELTEHNYTNVLGWLRPKKESMPKKDALTECLAQHSKLVTEDAQKDKTIAGLETEVLEKETKIGELQASLEEKETEIATLNKQVAAHKGEVTKKDTLIESLNTEITQLKAESHKDVAGETSKESMRLLVSGAVGAAVTYLYTRYPFLGQLGVEESVAVAAIVGYIFRIADKAVHTIGKNLGSDSLKGGLMRF